MLSLTYFSTALEPFSCDQLHELLEHSRRRNAEAALTGMLLYAGGHFVQTLEGDEASVEETFGRIRADQRHRDLLIALREPVIARVFPDWSMGFESLSEESARRLPGFSNFLNESGNEDAGRWGRAGVFHRLFRDKMR